jgi:AraC-like DNA-binding protein
MMLERLTELSNRYWQEYQTNGRTLPSLTVLRKEMVSDVETAIYEPVICLILQGRTETSNGIEIVDHGPGDVFLVNRDLPVVSRITHASPEAPYLAVILKVDLGLVRALQEQTTNLAFGQSNGLSIAAGRADQELVRTLERYLDLLDKPLDAQVLGSSILHEIHYRLLLSPAGRMLLSLPLADSHANQIAKAIVMLRRDFCAPLKLSKLAKAAGMSATSFHQYFKAATGTTPLQYQKDLRLITARALLAERRKTVTEVAFAVGYESPTHFSRDYKRKFNNAPGRDARDAV